jgi:hypothetical protein
MTTPTVAIAHDYLTQRGGAERVVLSLLEAFPDATVHTTLYDPEATYPEFRDARIVTSPLNRLGLIRRHHRVALPLLAPAARRLRVDADVTIASTSGWAHGFDVAGRLLVWWLLLWLFGPPPPPPPPGLTDTWPTRRWCETGSWPPTGSTRTSCRRPTG